MSISSFLSVGLPRVLLVIATSTAPARSRIPAKIERTFVGAAAWQVDEELGKRWQQISGRFIFQSSCLSCHQPASFTKAQWQEGLADFPDQDHEPLSREFSDLTAAFAYGRMVPDDASRLQSVGAFLASAAPSDTVGISSGPVDLLPQVGQRAPDFHISDTGGIQHSLDGYRRDQRALTLVFSRPHWCGPCGRQLVELRDDVDEFRAAGAQMLALHCEGSVEGTTQFARRRNLGFPLGNDGDLQVVTHDSMTSTYLIGPDGVSRARWLDRVHDRVSGATILTALNALNAGGR
jgi:peroxiredoxin